MDGVPESNTGATEALRQAEATLADAEQEEARKVAELRLCPHCQGEFAVLEMNCGSFVCGRDYHRNNLHGNVHGCGQVFNLNHAPRYTRNEAILEPLRTRINTVRARLVRSQRGAAKWNKAMAFFAPSMLQYGMNGSPGTTILPYSEMISSNEDTSDSARLIRIIWESTPLSECVNLLPTLIEVSALKESSTTKLSTPKFFLCLSVLPLGTRNVPLFGNKGVCFLHKLGDLMQIKLLSKRFDPVRVKYLLALWDRARFGVNAVLSQSNFTVMWEREEVRVPFRTIEDAKLVTILSEGSHPTEANDFLFLIIAEIIQAYNNFAVKLAESRGGIETMGDLKELQPRFLIHGFGTALKLATPVTKENLNAIAEA
jgi:hypothetical protein